MGTKISELQEHETAIDDDMLVIVDSKNSATKKITKGNLLKEVLESSSGALIAYNSISNSSDERLKSNIEDVDDKYIELLDNLEVKTYNFNNSELLDCGLVAQDVLEKEKELEIDESVLIRGTGEEREIEKNGETKTEIDYYALNYNNLTALLLKKVQQLEKRVKELEDKE